MIFGGYVLKHKNNPVGRCLMLNSVWIQPKLHPVRRVWSLASPMSLSVFQPHTPFSNAHRPVALSQSWGPLSGLCVDHGNTWGNVFRRSRAGVSKLFHKGPVWLQVFVPTSQEHTVWPINFLKTEISWLNESGVLLLLLGWNKNLQPHRPFVE